MIRCEDIRARVGDFELSVNFSVAEGQFLSLVGPSGSGKTTFLRVVAGLLAAEGGSCILDGQNIFEIDPEARSLGMVFQDYALFPHMNVYQNIEYGLKVQRRSKGDRHSTVRRLLHECALSKAADKKPYQLSGGEQQRVALARALAPDPRMLLLDEPLSAVDAHLREGLRAFIKELQRSRKITTFYVTHDRQEALSLSDLVAVLREGRIQQLGSPEEVYRRPANEYVAHFVGEGNVVPATVLSRSEEGILLSSDLGRFRSCDTLPPEAETARMFFRPEDLLPVDPAARGENIFSSELLRSELWGPFRKVVLRPRIISYRPSYEHNHPCSFRIPPESIRLFSPLV